MEFREYIIDTYGSSGNVVFADGLDDAIIGFEPSLWRVVYSRTKCIDICIKDGMDEEEAIEYLEYNTFSSYFAEKTPLFQPCIWVDDFKY